MLWIFTILSLNISDKVFAIFNYLCYDDGATFGGPVFRYSEGKL